MAPRDSFTSLVQNKTLQIVMAILVFAVGTAFALGKQYTDYPTKSDQDAAIRRAINRADHGSEEPLPPMVAGVPPSRGVAAALDQERTEREQADRDRKAEIDRVLGAVTEIHDVTIVQLRWQVSLQAAESEPNRLKRNDTAHKAVAKYDRLLARGYKPNVAAQRALESNPYE